MCPQMVQLRWSTLHATLQTLYDHQSVFIEKVVLKFGWRESEVMKQMSNRSTDCVLGGI